MLFEDTDSGATEWSETKPHPALVLHGHRKEDAQENTVHPILTLLKTLPGSHHTLHPDTWKPDFLLGPLVYKSLYHFTHSGHMNKL